MAFRPKFRGKLGKNQLFKPLPPDSHGAYHHFSLDLGLARFEYGEGVFTLPYCAGLGDQLCLNVRCFGWATFLVHYLKQAGQDT